MITELERKFFKAFDIGKPVIKKWYYDGYYEDFSWQCSEEDCTELLKYFDNSINKLNDRIQQMKKEKNTKFDRYTDSIDTEYGRLSGAYIIYPNITAKKLLEMICICSTVYPLTINFKETIDELKEFILDFCIRHNTELGIEQIKSLFMGGDNQCQK